MRLNLEVSKQAGLDEVIQKGIRFPDGSIIWAKPDESRITMPWKYSGDQDAVIVLDGPKAYQREFPTGRMNEEYQRHLQSVGANYDPEHDVLDLVERTIIIATTKPRVVKV